MKKNDIQKAMKCVYRKMSPTEEYGVIVIVDTGDGGLVVRISVLGEKYNEC